MDAFQKILVIVVFTFAFGTVGGCTTAEREHVDWLEKWSSVKKHRNFPVLALAKPGPVEPAPTDSPPAETAPAKVDPVKADPVETALAEPVPTEPALIDSAPVEREDISVEPDIETSAESEEAKEDVHDDSFSILADAFLAFRHKIAQAMRFPLENPSDIRRILSHLQVKNEKQLIQSWFAYNASVAVETPAYVEGIESLLREHTAENLLQRLQTERRFARQVSGAEDVLRRLRVEMRNDSLHLQILSQALLDVSKEWKHQKWGALEEDGDGDVVVHALAHLRMFIAVAEEHVGALRFIRDAHAETYTPTDLILTLGARRILGARTNEIHAIEHPKAFQCFRWARLNLDQCMASSYNPSEEAWCAGVHGVEDIAGCWQFLLPDESP